MAFVLAELFWVGVVPCLAAVAMVAARRFVLRPAAVWATSVGGAIIVGQFLLTARGGWGTAIDSLLRPNEAHEWLPWLVLVAIGIGVLAAYAPRSWRPLVVVLACLFALAVPARLLAGGVPSRWSTGEKFGVLLFWTAAIAGMWFTFAVGRANGQMRVRGGLLVVVAAGMAIAITLSGSIAIGQLCGVVAAALTGTLLGEACFRTPGTQGATASAIVERDVLSASAGVLAVALGGLILIAYYYANLSATNAVLLGAAVVAAGGRLPATWPRSPMGQAAARAALCLVPLAIALYLAYAAVEADQSSYPYASY